MVKQDYIKYSFKQIQELMKQNKIIVSHHMIVINGKGTRYEIGVNSLQCYDINTNLSIEEFLLEEEDYIELKTILLFYKLIRTQLINNKTKPI